MNLARYFLRKLGWYLWSFLSRPCSSSSFSPA